MRVPPAPFDFIFNAMLSAVMESLRTLKLILQFLHRKIVLEKFGEPKSWSFIFPDDTFHVHIIKNHCRVKWKFVGDLNLILSKTLLRSVRRRWQISRTRKISRPRCLRVIFTRKHFSKVSPTKIGLSSPEASPGGDSRLQNLREQTAD